MMPSRFSRRSRLLGLSHNHFTKLDQQRDNTTLFMSYAYARSVPGHPGISLHTDGQPYGSQIFGYAGSCPFMVRVLYYLDDLTPEVSLFRVVPRSHLSMHAHANPYKRHRSHPEEVMVTATAGSAALINHKVFHGNFPNVGNQPRELLAIAYRSAWAGLTVPEVAQWEESDLVQLPDTVRPFFADPNTRHWNFDGGNKPIDIADIAPGLNPMVSPFTTGEDGDQASCVANHQAD